VWIYFNNDHDAYAVKNARAIKRLLKRGASEGKQAASSKQGANKQQGRRQESCRQSG
jgi:uncharacterized protein YecE (DUF72 family)